MAPVDNGVTFGCGVGGIAGTDSPIAFWSVQPRGEVLSGTYGSVLEALESYASHGLHTDAAVVFFSKASGMEEFLRRANKLLPGIPWGGGGAALIPYTGSGETMPAAQDVVLLLIQDKQYRFRNVWVNVHDDTGRRVNFRAGGPRTILAVRENAVDLPAQCWYAASSEALRYPRQSFENLALASLEGWNLHTSPEGEFALYTGADLPVSGELAVRRADGEAATERIAAFCAQESALVFGCTGLLSLMQRQALSGTGTLAGFLHGEVLTASGSPRFANLMMSALIAEKGR